MSSWKGGPIGATPTAKKDGPRMLTRYSAIRQHARAPEKMVRNGQHITKRTMPMGPTGSTSHARAPALLIVEQKTARSIVATLLTARPRGAGRIRRSIVDEG